MRIISRKEWGALFGTGDPDAGPEPRVVIHHSYIPALEASVDELYEQAAVRSIERFHVHDKKWAGIGYNFLVAPSGRVYEGRGWKYRGAHAGPVNGSSIGICLLIDGTKTPANEKTIRSVRELIAEGLQLDELAANYVISGHRDHMVRTCPGDKVYAQLQEFRHDAPAEIPTVQPSVTTGPVPPPPGVRPIITEIRYPRREHVEELIRVRGAPPELVKEGLEVAEVLLRRVAAGQPLIAKRDVVKAVADAVADWVKERAA